MTLKISCPIYPTEDESKILGALKNIFPNCEFENTNGVFYSVCGDLSYFFDILNVSGLTDLFYQELDENSYVLLSKQAAVHGKVLLDEEQPLGNIKVVPHV